MAYRRKGDMLRSEQGTTRVEACEGDSNGCAPPAEYGDPREIQ